MNKPIFLIMLMFLLFVPIIIAQGETAAETAEAKTAQTVTEGTLDPNTPVVYNGVLIKGAEGASVTKDGTIDGKVALVGMGNIEVQNVGKFKSTPSGVIGVAGEQSIVDGHKLGEGSSFFYDKNTGELHVYDGGYFYVTDSLAQESVLDVSGQGARIKKDGTIMISEGTKLNLAQTQRDWQGSITDSMSLSFTPKDSASIKISQDDYYITGGAVVTIRDPDFIQKEGVAEEGILNIGGGGQIYFKEGKLSRIDFDNTGTSTYSYVLDVSAYTPEKFGTATATFSNYITGQDPDYPSTKKVAIVFDDSEVDKSKYDGVIDVKHYPSYDTTSLYSRTRTQMDISGEASVSLGNGFKYQGLNTETDSRVRMYDYLQELTVDHKLAAVPEEVDIAEISWGGKVETLSTQDGKMLEKWNTASLFEKDEASLAEMRYASSRVVLGDEGAQIYYNLDGGNQLLKFPSSSIIPYDESMQYPDERYKQIQSLGKEGIFGRINAWLYKSTTIEDIQKSYEKKAIQDKADFKKALEDWPSEWE